MINFFKKLINNFKQNRIEKKSFFHLPIFHNVVFGYTFYYHIVTPVQTIIPRILTFYNTFSHLIRDSDIKKLGLIGYTMLATGDLLYKYYKKPSIIMPIIPPSSHYLSYNSFLENNETPVCGPVC